MSTNSMAGSLSSGSLATDSSDAPVVLTRYTHLTANGQQQQQQQQATSASEAHDKLDPLGSNKLWAIAHQVVTPPTKIENQNGEGPFQIVWTNLSFKVDLNPYDKLINGLMKATQTLGGLRRVERFTRPCDIEASPTGSKSLVVDNHLSQISLTSTLSGTSQKVTGPEKRVIFENLNGLVKSGEITAILGPSGAGKTSLLNALCGRTQNYGGQIRLLGGGGEKRRMRLSIIPQKDYLIENLTVRENLLYSSRILNPTPDFQHEANILRVVRMLKLTACFNSIAANISGGEYKRVSIAQELLRQPDILILDEPTSGLDSLNCKNLIRSLATLIEASRRGQLQPIAIVMTIHQPDVDIFHMFDRVYCLARAGRVIYDGHPRDALQVIQSQAGLAEADCGSLTLSTNPANLLIEIASEDIHGLEPIERLARFHQKHFEQQLVAVEDQSEVVQVEKALATELMFTTKPSPDLALKRKSTMSPQMAATPTPTNGPLVRDKRLNAPKNQHSGLFWYHTRVLAARAFLSALRDPMMTMIALAFHLSIPFVMWTVYPRRIGKANACPIIQRDLDMLSLASNRTADKLGELQDELTTTFESSTMFYLTTYSFSMCSISVAALAFPLNMHILLKEVRNGWYNLPAYVVAKTLANFPFEVLFPVVSLVMIYLMLGMPSSPYEWRLCSIALVMALISMISHTHGLTYGALCMDSVQTSIFAAIAGTLPQTLLSGFTARIKYMPILLQKLSWTSQYRYSSDLINLSRYGFGICPCDATTEEYLRTKRADFSDVPTHLKPLFTYYLGNNEPTDSSTMPTTNSSDSLMTTMASNVTELVTDGLKQLVNTTEVRIPGVNYELMLNSSERTQLLKQVELGEVDMFERMADMTGRSFSYGRSLDQGCQAVRSQILHICSTPEDDKLLLLFAAMFLLLVVSKLGLFLVVRHQIGSRV